MKWITDWKRYLAVGTSLGMLAGLSEASPAQSSGKVLVVLSSVDYLTVKKDPEGRDTKDHPTGFFLSELVVPVKALVDAGYEPVFANPTGSRPVMDGVSQDNEQIPGEFWFGGDRARYLSYRAFCVELGLCGDGLVGDLQPRTLAEIVEEGTSSYRGVLVPGGHAPMQDLYRDPNLGKILRSFHQAKKPTALICHGPIALLSALDQPAEYGALAAQLNTPEGGKSAQQIQQQVAALTANWIYRGYRMTAFSSKEERQEEPGQDNVLGGYVTFYPDEALDLAGASVLVRAQKWQSNVVVDRELITGQNPFSDHAFAEALIKALDAQRPR